MGGGVGVREGARSIKNGNTQNPWFPFSEHTRQNVRVIREYRRPWETSSDLDRVVRSRPRPRPCSVFGVVPCVTRSGPCRPVSGGGLKHVPPGGARDDVPRLPCRRRTRARVGWHPRAVAGGDEHVDERVGFWATPVPGDGRRVFEPGGRSARRLHDSGAGPARFGQTFGVSRQRGEFAETQCRDRGAFQLLQTRQRERTPRGSLLERQGD